MIPYVISSIYFLPLKVFPHGCTLRTSASPTKRLRDLDCILILSITQSRDTMSNFATEQRFPLIQFHIIIIVTNYLTLVAKLTKTRTSKLDD